jgi:hypothetical protein
MEPRGSHMHGLIQINQCGRYSEFAHSQGAKNQVLNIIISHAEYPNCILELIGFLVMVN